MAVAAGWIWGHSLALGPDGVVQGWGRNHQSRPGSHALAWAPSASPFPWLRELHTCAALHCGGMRANEEKRGVVGGRCGKRQLDQ